MTGARKKIATQVRMPNETRIDLSIDSNQYGYFGCLLKPLGLAESESAEKEKERRGELSSSLQPLL